MSQSSHLTRTPAVAGMFYPADETTLKHDIGLYLQQAIDTLATPITPKAIVVPHAGYIFSGPIAASAYQLLIPLKDKIKRVVLLGPCHRVSFRGIALPQSDTFNTPLGNIPIDQKAIQQLAALDQVVISESAHKEEHSLEVQLPFLQEVLNDFTLVPLVIGSVSSDDVAEVINLLWGDEQTLIVISTDLSHYHSYYEAKQLDRSTSDAVTNLRPELIDYEDACGRDGLKAIIAVASQKHLSANILDLRNSGDTAGDKDRVVGYGAYAFH